MSAHSRANPDAAAIAVYFALGPALVMAAYLWDVSVLGHARGWRAIAIHGVASPVVGYLLWVRARRARFATYIFLTMDILRSLVAGALVPLVVNAAILGYLQTPRMRHVYPRIDSAEMLARIRRDA